MGKIATAIIWALYWTWLIASGVEALRARPNSPPAFNESAVYAFHVRYDKFTRELWGCPPRGYEPCQASLGVFDAREWERTRKLGQAAFR